MKIFKKYVREKELIQNIYLILRIKGKIHAKKNLIKQMEEILRMMILIKKYQKNKLINLMYEQYIFLNILYQKKKLIN